MGTSFFKITKADNIKDINEKSEKLFCILLWGVIKKYYLKQNIKLEKKKYFHQSIIPNVKQMIV